MSVTIQNKGHFTWNTEIQFIDLNEVVLSFNNTNAHVCEYTNDGILRYDQ